MKTIGIIGGLGPEATAQFYLRIVEEFDSLGLKRYPSVLMYSIPLSFEVAAGFHLDRITESTRERMYGHLYEGVKRLGNSGADVLTIPCNTVHILMDRLRQESDLPILSIVESVAEYAVDQGYSTLGLLGTKITMSSDLYPGVLKKHGVKILKPGEKEQEVVAGVTERILEKTDSPRDREQILMIIQGLQDKGAEAVVLGCTELPLLVKQEHTRVVLIDTIKVLAKAAVSYSKP